jgi:hypothetical protein
MAQKPGRAESFLDWPSLLIGALLGYLMNSIPPLGRLWSYLKGLSPTTKIGLVTTFIMSFVGQSGLTIWVMFYGTDIMFSLPAFGLAGVIFAIAGVICVPVDRKLKRHYGLPPD